MMTKNSRLLSGIELLQSSYQRIKKCYQLYIKLLKAFDSSL